MKAKFKTLYTLMIILMMCGLALFVCSGCGNDDDDDADNGGKSRSNHDYSEDISLARLEGKPCVDRVGSGDR